MGAEDPLFILYTSGSTGKPKGVLHTTAGYLLYSALTFKTVFDYRDEDVFWCTADIGWVTGHSYIVYGPLAAGATTLMFEGIPTYPDPGRFWAVVEKYRVNSFYTAPTAIRALMRHGEGWPARYDLSSLRLLGTVGEPINPEVWQWYREHHRPRRAADRRHLLADRDRRLPHHAVPGRDAAEAGERDVPFFGVSPGSCARTGAMPTSGEGGYLVVDKPWPGMMRGTWGDPENSRMREVYFERFPGIATSPATARAWTRTATTGSSAASTTSST
jgi:acetyl-CoA synthetase